MVKKGKKREVKKSENLEGKRSLFGKLNNIFYNCLKVLFLW